MRILIAVSRPQLDVMILEAIACDYPGGCGRIDRVASTVYQPIILYFSFNGVFLRLGGSRAAHVVKREI